jgi:hypothetical protein
VTSARKGKIASLPRPLRDEVSRRLDDGQPGSVILPWINTRPEVRRILKARWDGRDITDQNLTEWRQGGYLDWLEHQSKAEKTRALADLSFAYAKAAGGDLSEGALAAAAGRVMETMESLEGDDLNKTLAALAKVRAMELKAKQVAQNDKVLEHREQQLALERQKFQRLTCELFIKWFDQEQARKIVEGKASKQVKMDELSKLLFGEKPELVQLQEPRA